MFCVNSVKNPPPPRCLDKSGYFPGHVFTIYKGNALCKSCFDRAIMLDEEALST